VDVSELVMLAASDGELFCRTFFPKVFRQESPSFHKVLWDDWRDPSCELTADSVFRGGGKTTLIRAFILFSACYGLSRTILYAAASGTKADESVNWIRRIVEGSSENGTLLARTFGLRPGSKWNDERIDIVHEGLGHTVSIIPAGITSGIRGLNIEGYRPDLIILDDIQTEENVGTPEQLRKTNEVVYGSIRKTLAPRSEAPNSRMIMAQTPMKPRDIISQAEQDPEWRFRRFGIRDDAGKSRWEARFPSAQIDAEERGASARNQWALFARESLCINVPDEGQYFRESDLRFYENAPERMVIAYAIDPVPPPSAAQIESGLAKKDYEAHVVVGITPDRDVYVLEYALSKNHHPDWSSTKLFELAGKWRPLRVRIHAVAYEVTLKWYFEEEMKKRGTFHVVEAWKDQRPKPIRIRQSLSALAAHGKLYVKRGMTEFLQQWAMYPGVDHDDLLDSTATAVSLVLELAANADMDDLFGVADSGAAAQLPVGWRRCP
jgi:phage terminase large subunit-like protein